MESDEQRRLVDVCQKHGAERTREDIKCAVAHITHMHSPPPHVHVHCMRRGAHGGPYLPATLSLQQCLGLPGQQAVSEDRQGLGVLQSRVQQVGVRVQGGPGGFTVQGSAGGCQQVRCVSLLSFPPPTQSPAAVLSTPVSCMQRSALSCLRFKV